MSRTQEIDNPNTKSGRYVLISRYGRIVFIKRMRIGRAEKMHFTIDEKGLFFIDRDILDGLIAIVMDFGVREEQ